MARISSTGRTGAPAAVAMWIASTDPTVASGRQSLRGARARETNGPRRCVLLDLPLKPSAPPRVGGGGSAALPHEPPLRRELTFVGVGQATWLVPFRGVTVAGQRRIPTGLRWLYTGQGVCARQREDTSDAGRARHREEGREVKLIGGLGGGGYSRRKMRIAIAVFDGAEELDFAGPWEVLAAWRFLYPDDV